MTMSQRASAVHLMQMVTLYMELSDGEGRGTQGSCVRSEPSDDEDMPEDDEEVELSMIFDPDIRN